MLLKKAMAVMFFLNILVSISFAQKKDSLGSTSVAKGKQWYYQIDIGYNFVAGNESLLNETYYRDGTYSKEYTNMSFGKGFNIALGVGKKLNKNLGIELELGYVIGGKNVVENQYYYTEVANPFIEKQSISYKANTFHVNPKIMLEVPFEKGNALYGKIGYLLGTGKAQSNYKLDWDFDNGQAATGTIERVYTGGIISGSTMAAGFRFGSGEAGSYFFIEATGNNLHRTFAKNTITESFINGYDVLEGVPAYYTQTVYIDKVTYNTEPIDENKPYVAPSFRSNYSSVGFRLGIIKYF